MGAATHGVEFAFLRPGLAVTWIWPIGSSGRRSATNCITQRAVAAGLRPDGPINNRSAGCQPGPQGGRSAHPKYECVRRNSSPKRVTALVKYTRKPAIAT